jgi:sulfoxide reductase heme-binding subunit YedZ
MHSRKATSRVFWLTPAACAICQALDCIGACVACRTAAWKASSRVGLSFALSHATHLFAIIALVEIVFGGNYSQLGDIVGGSVIYLFIFAMAVTSNNASVKLLGAKNWKRLHKTGSYLIWIGLFSSYLGNALETDALHYWLYFALGVGLLLLRIWAFRDKRMKGTDQLNP